MSNFEEEKLQRIAAMPEDEHLTATAAKFLEASVSADYSYNFSWSGRPIIQYPQDIVAMQELIWSVKPDLIIETGIAHGGSLIFSASMLAHLDLCDAIEAKEATMQVESKRRVLGVDIDIRAHNRTAIEAHPMYSRIDMIQGSSIDEAIVAEVKEYASKFERVLVCLDSNHTHDHVLAELNAYAPLTSVGSYCVVFDTLVEDMPAHTYPNRPWGPGDNPKTAVWEYLKSSSNFEIDAAIHDKLLVTVASDGYLKRVN